MWDVVLSGVLGFFGDNWFGLLIGLAVGWNFPQPEFTKNLTKKVAGWLSSFFGWFSNR